LIICGEGVAVVRGFPDPDTTYEVLELPDAEIN